MGRIARAFLFAGDRSKQSEKPNEQPHGFFRFVPQEVVAPSLAAPLSEDVGMSMLKSLLKDESGATAIEYGLIAAGIAVAIIVVVRGVGTNLNATFQAVKDNLQ